MVIKSIWELLPTFFLISNIIIELLVVGFSFFWGFLGPYWLQVFLMVESCLCNAQVNNRDISIAVLRSFIAKRKQEHEAKLSKRSKSGQKLSENNGSETATEEAFNGSATNEEKCHTDCDAHEKPSNECGSPMLSEEQKEIVEGKEQRGPKPIRVLEVVLISLAFYYVMYKVNS